VEPPPIRIEAPTEIVLNYGDTAQVSTWVYNIRGDSIVSWRPDNGYLSCVNCLQPVVRPLETTVYYLRVSDVFGCYDEVRIPVIVERPRRVFLPTAFSPNGDGNNDLFFPNGAREVALIHRLEIYNRWGSSVFERRNFPPNDPAQGWDGTFNGQELPAAVYAYFIEIGFTDGTVITYAGDVVLVR
jgi:gliding motility-associated-like protein